MHASRPIMPANSYVVISLQNSSFLCRLRAKYGDRNVGKAAILSLLSSAFPKPNAVAFLFELQQPPTTFATPDRVCLSYLCRSGREDASIPMMTGAPPSRTIDGGQTGSGADRTLDLHGRSNQYGRHHGRSISR